LRRFGCPFLPCRTVFPGTICADVPYACADPSGSPDGMPTARTSLSKACAGGNIPLPLDDRGTRSQHASTSTSCSSLSRNGEAPSEILFVAKEPDMMRFCTTQTTCRVRTLTGSRLRLDKRASPLLRQPIAMGWLSACRSVGWRAAYQQNSSNYNDVFGTGLILPPRRRWPSMTTIRSSESAIVDAAHGSVCNPS